LLKLIKELKTKHLNQNNTRRVEKPMTFGFLRGQLFPFACVQLRRHCFFFVFLSSFFFFCLLLFLPLSHAFVQPQPPTYRDGREVHVPRDARETTFVESQVVFRKELSADVLPTTSKHTTHTHTYTQYTHNTHTIHTQYIHAHSTRNMHNAH